MEIYPKKNSINIVAYHYIREIKNSKFKNLKGIEYVFFKKQIKFYKKKFNIISPDDLIEILNKKKRYKKPCLLLTFDDGYIDHYKYVFPLLVKEKIKGCFYPPIDIFKGKVLDVNKIHFILEKCQDTLMLFNTLKLYLKKNYKLNINKEKLKKINSISKINPISIPEYDDASTILIKKLLQNYLPAEIRKNACNFLFKKFVKIDLKTFSKQLYLNLKQLKEMDKAGMHIGCHGVNHVRWKTWSFKKQLKEIKESKKFFDKKKINTKNFSVCYPWGSYNQNSAKVLKKLNIKFGLTSDHGNFTVNKKSNKYKLPRFDANDFLKV
jgi:peptidoglycan/xylan/chitin deacetylase (PgdA/CDA1 family)